MGGRGGSSGLSGGSSKSSKPSYFKETEKAVQLKIRVEDYTLDKELSRIVWVPKSQLAEDGRPSNWITEQKAGEFYNSDYYSNYSATWEDSKGNKFGSSMTKREREYAENQIKRFESGRKSYEELVAKAKSMGIKGVRVGMRRTTIQKKIDEFEEKNKKKK